MITCDDFVLLHLHKSGGTFLNHVILNARSDAKRIGYHLPYSEVPSEAKDLPVLGTVRNPWAYYVSWFHFQSAQDQPNILYQAMSEEGSLGFKRTITNLLTLCENADMIDRLAERFPETYQSSGLNVTSTCIRSLLGSGRGFYSFLYRRLYEGADDLFIANADNLRGDVARFVSDRMIGESSKILTGLAISPKLNVSRHEHYAAYYDTALRDLVLTQDSDLIEVYGYRFG